VINRQGEVVVGTALVAVLLGVRTGTSPVPTYPVLFETTFSTVPIWMRERLLGCLNLDIAEGVVEKMHYDVSLKRKYFQMISVYASAFRDSDAECFCDSPALWRDLETITQASKTPLGFPLLGHNATAFLLWYAQKSSHRSLLRRKARWFLQS